MKTGYLVVFGSIWAMMIPSVLAQQLHSGPAAPGISEGVPAQGVTRRTPQQLPMRRWSDEQGYHLQILVGSDDPSAVDLKLHRGYLTVNRSNAYRADHTTARGGYSFEHRASRFSRRFRLPANADARNMTQRMENGVLTVTLPRVNTGNLEGQPPYR